MITGDNLDNAKIALAQKLRDLGGDENIQKAQQLEQEVKAEAQATKTALEEFENPETRRFQR